MLKKYNSKNANADRITRTITTYRVIWNALEKGTMKPIKKFKDISCKVDDDDKLELVSSFYRDGETDKDCFPLVSDNSDVEIETIEKRYYMTATDFMKYAKEITE